MANDAVAAIEEAARGDKEGKHAITLRDALALYVAKLEGEAKSKRSAYEMKRLTGKTLGDPDRFPGRHALNGDMYLHELTGGMLEALRLARFKEGNAAQTVAHEIKMLRATCYYLHDLETWRTPDIRKWPMPKLKPRTRYLSWEEFEAVYALLSPDRLVTPTRNGRPSKAYSLSGMRRTSVEDAQDLLVALALSGGRWGAVAALTWDRVDLEKGIIRLFATKTQDSGERDPERTIPMPPQVSQVIARRFATRDPSQPLVFPSRSGKLRRGSNKTILRAINEAGLNRPDLVERYGRATVHSLRHTFASWLRQNGADLDEVQYALGHSNLTMTKRYAHLGHRQTVDKLGSILSGVSAPLGR